jgi:hypothetical protein
MCCCAPRPRMGHAAHAAPAPLAAGPRSTAQRWRGRSSSWPGHRLHPPPRWTERMSACGGAAPWGEGGARSVGFDAMHACTFFYERPMARTSRSSRHRTHSGGRSRCPVSTCCPPVSPSGCRGCWQTAQCLRVREGCWMVEGVFKPDLPIVHAAPLVQDRHRCAVCSQAPMARRWCRG